jgi:PEP-CTERM putative exosortase interaction domain
MNIKRILTWAGLTAGTALATLASPDAAFSLTPFSFSTNFTGFDPKGDIWLNSVTTGLGPTYSSFNLVSGANIISNDVWTGGNTGAASADRGSLTTTGVNVEDLQGSPGEAHIVTSLGNLNLNNIIDTEDQGNFVIELLFKRKSDRFFFWERGMNSKLLVEALDDLGNVLSSYLMDSSTFDNAGFAIHTMEPNNLQAVGAQGLKLDGVTSKRLRLTASGAAFNGPDFKVVAVASVPEPATIAGTVLAAGAAVAARRKRKAQAEA